jgi:hypothetical protein
MVSEKPIAERLIEAVGAASTFRPSQERERLADLLERLNELRERGLLPRPRYLAPSPGDLERQYSPCISNPEQIFRRKS